MASPRYDDALLRRVVKTVFAQVAAEGVDGASMRKVAAATQLSTGTLNYHFGNKQGLLVAALDYAYRAPRDWERDLADPRAALGRLLARYVLDRASIRTWWRFWCAVTAHAPRDPELARRQEENQAALLGFFTEALSHGVTRGAFFVAEPRVEAEAMVALGYGVALRQLIDESPLATARARALLDAAVKRLG